MLNIVIPMAGAGSRFAVAGFADPKPLIPIHGVPMIRLVIENLRPAGVDHRFIFIVRSEHVERYRLTEQLAEWAPGSVVIPLDALTDGAARTVLAARSVIDCEDPLMIANSDQYVEVDIDDYLAHASDVDGLIMTMTADDPKWSFARLDEQNNVVEVVEKTVVSNQATVGIYNFARGSDFVWAADEMIRQKKQTNGEYYVAPAYNELVARGQVVRTYSIGTEADGMYGLGIPSDLALFESLPLSIAATAFAE